jgi:protocatechuate 3,4-dioxygenase beta subunit
METHEGRHQLKGTMMRPTRRSVLAALLSATSLPVVGSDLAVAQARPVLDLTPDCHDGDEPTIAQTAGPYFKPDAPLKRDFAVDAPNGERITIAGFVLDAGCRPVPKTLVQIWHADERGSYDTKGYRLRGYQYVDDAGRWWFSTIVPAAYPGRTRHYHVKVQRPGGRVLTTQMYFPNEPLNRRDGLFDERLLLRISDSADGRVGRFDFVV